MTSSQPNSGGAYDREVRIRPNAIIVPLGTIVVIRKGSEYGAVKFTEYWTGATRDDQYGRYESYYQGDNSGDFSKANVRVTKGDLSMLKPIGWAGLHCAPGNPDFRCGPIKLGWSGTRYSSAVYFFSWGQDQGDYGIELAPTKWTDISEVNVFDLRLKWYRYDENRKTISIPIDELW